MSKDTDYPNPKLNTQQRIVVAVVVPILLFFLGYGLMTIIDSSHYYAWSLGKTLGWGWDFTPTDIGESWWGWLIVFLALGTFEFIWFRNPHRKTTEGGRDERVS